MATGIDLSNIANASARYSKLEGDRRPFLDRARDAALVTIPSLMPPQGFGPSSKLTTPYQSLGARGVRTLASKLLLSLFPNSTPFFNYQIDDLSLKAMQGPKKGDIQLALSERERAVCSELDLSLFRPAAFTGFMQLLVSGTIILSVPPGQDERARLFRLDQFVVRRDNAGNLLEFIIKESVDFHSLPEEVVAELATRAEYKEKDGKLGLDESPVDLYTHVIWDNKSRMWIIYQEASGIRLEDSVGSYKKDALPFRVVDIFRQPGEDYGRGYVEEYLGDLDSLEALSEALVEGSAAAAKLLFLVDPAGSTSIKVVAEAKTGSVRSGRAGDVTVVQAEKQADLQVAKAQAEEISTRLGYAFMLHSSIQRNGERVTAEEIRYMATELDSSLGGIYTLLAAEFQLPVVKLLETRMEKRLGSSKAPPLPKDLVKPVIVTGLEAIGRGHDQANLRAFIQEVLQTLGPEQALQYIKPLELMKRAAAAYSINTEGLIPTEDEVAKKQQEQQMMAMAQSMGPEALKQGGGMAQKAMDNQQQQDPQAQ